MPAEEDDNGITDTNIPAWKQVCFPAALPSPRSHPLHASPFLDLAWLVLGGGG